MADDLVKRLDNLWAMLEEEGHYVKANTVTLAKERIEALERSLATCEKYRDAYAECDRIGTQAVRDLEAKLAKAVEAHQRIVQWADAYPLAVFPEPDLKAVQQALSAAGLSLDAVSASNMRHVVKGAGDISRATLDEIEGGGG
jgi:hypothetical protein